MLPDLCLWYFGVCGVLIFWCKSGFLHRRFLDHFGVTQILMDPMAVS